MTPPTPPPKVSGKYLRALFDAMGIDWRDVYMTRIEPSDLLEVTYYNRGPNGEKWRAGNGVASVTVRTRIEWEAP